MNKRVYIWASVTVIFLYIVSKTQLPVALFTFLVLGMIPGTNVTLPTWAILATYPLAFFAAVYWLATQPLYVGERPKQTAPKPKITHKKKAAKVTASVKPSTVAKRRSRAAV